MRVLPHENPLCQRVACDHPLKGGRREGHFDMGLGPCKAPGCPCASFQATDPALDAHAPRPLPERDLLRPAMARLADSEYPDGFGPSARVPQTPLAPPPAPPPGFPSAPDGEAAPAAS